MIKKIHLTLLFLITLLFTSCLWDINDDNPDDIVEPLVSAYEPVVLKRTTFENATEIMSVQPLQETGKIYVKDQYLLINEPNKGFHVYDNSNPSSPVNIKFLKVLGSSDITIKGNVLYINNAVDLIAVTYNADFSEIQITKRIENVFPEIISPDGFYHNRETDEVTVDWTLN